jgi:pimeloyl-ACP methyl ester carboxylesterase
VVLDGGLGDMSASWILVQQEVSDTTRVCAYDRTGMGWSQSGPEPRDAKQISSELHTLLSESGIEGPYVVVGHSFGGLYTQTYAARYPEEVEGVTLVESSHPEQFSHRP